MRTPNFYKQYDSRWGAKSWNGQTIRAHGCGPTCIANIISACTALNYSKITPVDTFNWICKNGYMSIGHGTAWEGITKCLAHYGIKSTITTDKVTVKAALKKNNFAIPLMGPGLWTSGGHFIVAYYVDSKDQIYISDPASNKESRQKNKFNTFWGQCKRSWMIIDTEKYFKQDNTPKKSETYTLYVYAKEGYVHVRSGRGTKFESIGKLVNGKKLSLHKYSSGWYQIKSGKYKGYYVAGSELSKTQLICKKFKVVAKHGLRVRDSYTTKGKILKVVPFNTKVTASKIRGNWAYVPSAKGWMCIKDSKKTYLKEV